MDGMDRMDLMDSDSEARHLRRKAGPSPFSFLLSPLSVSSLLFSSSPLLKNNLSPAPATPDLPQNSGGVKTLRFSDAPLFASPHFVV
jgi:hypothetical protein